ncbi:MAG TPA: adenosylmethionine--8-amino-7-oxononanoate transaminase [Cytophagaceae bacterium]|jgi:adenosylmethionine-8-amino-7-oxononanoate aminotransferase|nr:adenosylmethionine--8-amino-7-oxononanoate transaminase [Cytophagaceae bacterium]
MNNDLVSKDKEYLWHPYTSLQTKQDTILVSAASGIYLHTKDGRKIIDAVSSWWVNIHGHGHPYLTQKLSEQVATLDHVIFAGFTHEPAIRLAERLVEILPGSQKRIFFSDNGSTAVEVAIKMAIQYTINNGKEPGKIIALEGAFHGDTFGAMAVSERGIFTDHFSKYLFEVDFIPFPEEGTEDNVLRIFEEKIRANTITAFIYEPLIQGAAGMRTYSAEVLEKLLSIAKKNGVICIADEVMTGFGRTGKLFASEYMITKPDIVCLSKAITGGLMPFGVTACNAEIESAFLNSEIGKTFFHGHSFMGNPLACALSNASLDLLLTKDYAAKIEQINKLYKEFEKKIKNLKGVKKVSVLGTILSIEIDTNGATSYTNSIRDELYNFFLDKDILMRPLGNIIYIIPPYIIEESELNLIFSAIMEMLKKRAN